ncbi:MAG: alpha/beta hydrolase [Iphinoe sp. HA4291-MV1]|jgi:pimeloyl-ACP methyl ester carboxylesterase|nr:alpha/beta hydrolase [Iphinoe sp. HA4291-MV1]
MTIPITQANDENYVRACTTERKFAATIFGDIAYYERGTGDVILFFHGFPLNHFQWRGVIDQLSLDRRCIAPDFMGLGYTKVAPGQGVTPSDQANMIAAFLDHLSIKSVDLIANDSGTGVAQLFVTRFPERVRTLLLTNGDVEPDSPPPPLVPFIQMAREGKFADEFLVSSVQDKERTRSLNGLGGLTYSNPANLTDAAINYYFSPLINSEEDKKLVNAYASSLDPNPLKGIESALRQCTVPTRIIWGMSEVIFSLESPDYLARILPNSKGVRRIADGKLFFPEEYPDVIAEEARLLWTA